MVVNEVGYGLSMSLMLYLYMPRSDGYTSSVTSRCKSFGIDAHQAAARGAHRLSVRQLLPRPPEPSRIGYLMFGADRLLPHHLTCYVAFDQFRQISGTRSPSKAANVSPVCELPLGTFERRFPRAAPLALIHTSDSIGHAWYHPTYRDYLIKASYHCRYLSPRPKPIDVKNAPS